MLRTENGNKLLEETAVALIYDLNYQSAFSFMKMKD
jgi:hypothetical protein